MKVELSPYTIASNCSDIDDCNAGIQELYQAYDKYKKEGKKEPSFIWSRIDKLEAKRDKLSMKQYGMKFDDRLRTTNVGDSKIAEFDKYKIGKLKGECTNFPEKENLNNSDDAYRRGYCVGKKLGAKKVLESAFSDSSDIRKLIEQYRKTKDSATYDLIVDSYQRYLSLNGRMSDSSKNKLKSLISKYKKTKDSNIYNIIISLYSKIKDENNDDFVLFEGKDGEVKLGKRFSKEDLKSAKDYIDKNEDTKVVGEDEDGSVIVSEKDSDDDSENVIEQDDLNNNNNGE